MKYLHDDVLAALSSYLMDCPMLDDNNGFSASSGNGGDGGGSSSAANTRILHGRIEAYTTKRTQQEKGYAVQLLERYVEAQESNEKEMQMATTLFSHNNNDNKNGSSRGRNARKQGHQHKRRRSQSTSEAGGDDDEEEERLRLRPAGRFRSYSLDEGHKNKKPTRHSTALPSKPPSQQFMSRAFSTSAVPSSSSTGGGNSPLHLQHQSRRLWTDLILTLNLSFPDFDFTDHATSFAGDRLFTAVPLQTAVNAINQKIGDNKMLRLNFWPAIDNVVGPLSQIPTVYSFIDTEDIIKSKLLPSKTQDNTNNGPPQAGQEEEQVIWSVNYFFVNKVAKRIVFFTCIETMRPNNEPLLMMPEDEEENVPATSSSRHYDDDMVKGGRRDGEMEDDEDEDDVDDHSDEEEEDQSEFDMDPSMSAGGIPIG
jgi:hypothetical protein